MLLLRVKTVILASFTLCIAIVGKKILLAPVSVQPQQSRNLLATPHNSQIQIAQSVGPQNHNFDMNGPLQHQEQQGFVHRTRANGTNTSLHHLS